MKQISRKKLIALVIAVCIGLPMLLLGIAAWSFMRNTFPNFMLPPTRLTTVLGRDFSQSVEEQLYSYGFVDFNELTDFEWNQMLIATPYQNPWQLLENNGIRRQRMNTGIMFEDWQNLLIFLNDNRVVAYINLSRGIADFSSSIPSGEMLQRENTTFVVSHPESFWHGWHGTSLFHWSAGEWLPLRSRLWEEFADAVIGDNESPFVFVEPLTDPDAIARHEFSRALFPFAPSSRTIYVPHYEEGTLPPYIIAEIVSLSLFESPSPPDIPNESIGNQSYSTGDLFGFYTGTLHYVRYVSEYIGDGWWAVASWWEGILYLMMY